MTGMTELPTPLPTADETWEYVYMEAKMGQIEREMPTMNKAGSEGWELVSAFPCNLGGWHDPAITTHAVFMFKRRRRR